VKSGRIGAHGRVWGRAPELCCRGTTCCGGPPLLPHGLRQLPGWAPPAVAAAPPRPAQPRGTHPGWVLQDRGPWDDPKPCLGIKLSPVHSDRGLAPSSWPRSLPPPPQPLVLFFVSHPDLPLCQLAAAAHAQSRRQGPLEEREVNGGRESGSSSALNEWDVTVTTSSQGDVTRLVTGHVIKSSQIKSNPIQIQRKFVAVPGGQLLPPQRHLHPSDGTPSAAPSSTSCGLP